VNDDNDNPYNAYEMSPDGQRQKDNLTALSSSKEEKTGNLMKFSLYVNFYFAKGACVRLS
jgi:hypothetical protein